MVFDKIKGPLFVLCICYCAIFIAFYSSVISCGKTFQERMSLIMYIAKGMRDECRLKNAAEKFHILFIIYKNKKGFRK